MLQLMMLLAEAPTEGQQQSPSMTPIFILACVMMFLFMVVFPAQRRQKKEQEKVVSSLKRGAKVLTSGGIVGLVVSAKDGEDEIVIRSEDSRFRIKRNVVVQILGTDEAEANKQ
jgi:preprotein translocase subunit YajC